MTHGNHETPVFGCAPPGVICRPRQAAYAIITNTEGRVATILVRLRDGRDVYWLPGGGIELGESPREAVTREVREELGRGVSVQGEMGEAIQFFYAANEQQWYEMKAQFFLAVFDDSPVSEAESQLHWADHRADGEMFFHKCHAWAASRRHRGDLTTGCS